MTPLIDTAPEVERLMYEAYRRMFPARQWKNLRDAYRMARALHAAGMRYRNPAFALADIQADWIRSVLGRPCPGPIPETLREPIDQEYSPSYGTHYGRSTGSVWRTPSAARSPAPCSTASAVSDRHFRPGLTSGTFTRRRIRYTRSHFSSSPAGPRSR